MNVQSIVIYYGHSIHMMSIPITQTVINTKVTLMT